jgi:hypothetical protein
MKAKILYTDPSMRFKADEIGTVMKNDFPKYDYKIDLGVIKSVKIFGDGIPIDMQRIFYFYKNEVQIFL